MEWVLSQLVAWQHSFRIAVFILTAANMAWVAPRAWRALRGDISGEAAAYLGVFMVLLGQCAFQAGYVMERVPDSAHWRNAANLMILIVGCAVLLGSRLIFFIERRIREERK